MPLSGLKPRYSKVEQLERYYFYLQVKRSSAKTITVYRNILNRFFSAVEDPYLVDRSYITKWVTERRQSVSVGTFNAELSAIRSFYRWSQESEHIDTDTLKYVPRSHRAQKRLPRYLTEEQVGKLLAAPDLSCFVGFRDHVILRLLYETGMRASEVTSLQLGSILGDRTILVFGKGGHERIVPHSEELGLLIDSWYSVRRSVKPGNQNTLFVTQKGRPFSSGRSIWEIIDRYARKALGVGKGYERVVRTANNRPWQGQYPHLLRASFATHLLTNHCDLRSIQEMLGHSSVATTALYLGVDLEYLKAEHSKLPRAKKRDILT